MQTKMVIVVRKDLNMRKGKLAAQVGHAVLRCILKQHQYEYDTEFIIPKTVELDNWLHVSLEKKIVLGCSSEQDLLDIQQQCRIKHINTALITDAGLTEFHNIPTKTCIGIGPDEETIIDTITGMYTLL